MATAPRLAPVRTHSTQHAARSTQHAARIPHALPRANAARNAAHTLSCAGYKARTYHGDERVRGELVGEDGVEVNGRGLRLGALADAAARRHALHAGACTRARGERCASAGEEGRVSHTRARCRAVALLDDAGCRRATCPTARAHVRGQVGRPGNPARRRRTRTATQRSGTARAPHSSSGSSAGAEHAPMPPSIWPALMALAMSATAWRPDEHCLLTERSGTCALRVARAWRVFERGKQVAEAPLASAPGSKLPTSHWNQRRLCAGARNLLNGFETSESGGVACNSCGPANHSAASMSHRRARRAPGRAGGNCPGTRAAGRLGQRWRGRGSRPPGSVVLKDSRPKTY